MPGKKQDAYLKRWRDRRKEMARMRDQGLTLAEIGKRYGITYQAVQSALRGR